MKRDVLFWRAFRNYALGLFGIWEFDILPMIIVIGWVRNADCTLAFLTGWTVVCASISCMIAYGHVNRIENNMVKKFRSYNMGIAIKAGRTFMLTSNPVGLLIWGFWWLEREVIKPLVEASALPYRNLNPPADDNFESW